MHSQLTRAFKLFNHRDSVEGLHLLTNDVDSSEYSNENESRIRYVRTSTDE